MARKALGLTQAELALAAGVGLRFVVELEAGKPTVRLERVLPGSMPLTQNLPLQAEPFSDQEGEQSPVEERGFKPDKCSRSKRASLDSIAS